MRPALLSFALVAALGACSGPLPFQGLTALGDPTEAGRRGAVEVAVKSGWPAILAEIEAGGGPTLTSAMDAANIPAADRPGRLLQLRADLGLYTGNPGALTLALFTYGR